ncbi:MAG: hypothetical protein ABI759_06825 [Candidatus Solibacter sp.]
MLGCFWRIASFCYNFCVSFDRPKALIMITTGDSPEKPAAGSAPSPAGDSPFSALLIAALQRPSSPIYHLAFACAAGLIAAACFYVGVVPTRQYASDLTSFADCAWRLLQGLRPHIDFSTGFGLFPFLMWEWALKLGRGTVTGFGYIDAIVAVVAGTWGYIVLTRRVGGILAVTGGLMILLLAVAPCAPGESFRLSTHAMHYNRWGFALLAVLIAESFPLRSGVRTSSLTAGFASGILVALLVFLKPNYGGGAVALAAASLVWNEGRPWRRLAGLGAGAALAALPFLAYIDFQIGKLLADVRMAADARGGAIAPGFVAEIFFNALPGFLIVAALAMISQHSNPTRPAPGLPGLLRNYRCLLLSGAILALGILLLLTNSQLDRLPLHEILLLLLLDSILNGAVRRESLLSLGLVLVVAGAILGWVGSDFLAVANGVRLARSVPNRAADPLVHRINVGGFAPAWLLDDYNQDSPSANHGAFVVEYLSDGAALLRREIRPGEKVTAFDTYNPLAFAVGARPARGGLAFARYHYHFGDRSHPDPETYFGDADIVMYPKTPDAPPQDFAGLVKYYGPVLERQFVPVAESARWKLYRRRGR